MMFEAVTQWANENLVASVLALVFVGFVGDYLWARYMRAVSEHKRFAAANWSLACTVVYLFLTLSIVEKSVIHICGYLVGGYLGTFLGTKRNEEK